MTKYLDLTEIDKNCRVCLERTSELIPLTSCIYINNEGLFIRSTIEQVLTTINSQECDFGESPTGICFPCKNLVEVTFELKTKLETSTAILQELVANNISAGNNCVKDEIILEEPDQEQAPDMFYEELRDDELILEDKSFQDHPNTTPHISGNSVINSPPVPSSRVKRGHNKEKYVKTEAEEYKHRKEIKARHKSNKPIELILKHRQIQTEILHQCPICPLQFSALDFKKHIHTHKSFKKYLNIPNKLSRYTKFYASPRKTVTLINSSKQILHKCLHCEKELPIEEFCKHVGNHQQDEIKCEKCNRVFSRISHLTNHQYHHKQDFPFTCEICQKGFIVKSSFDYHVLTHTNEQLPFVCDYCQKRFANPLHLQRHSLIHTENITYTQKYRVHKCHTCLRGFRTYVEFDSHKCSGVPLQLPHYKKKKYVSVNSFNQRSQVEIKVKRKYQCMFCPKTYTTASGRYTHIQIVHKGRSQRMLCSVCGEYVKNIKDHMMRHSGIKPHKCHICPKSFVTKHVLKQHLIVHSGERPYICTGCGKTFNNLYNLQVHERIHSGVKKHLCAVCGKAFLEKSYLNKHLKVHKQLKYEMAFE